MYLYSDWFLIFLEDLINLQGQVQYLWTKLKQTEMHHFYVNTIILVNALWKQMSNIFDDDISSYNFFIVVVQWSFCWWVIKQLGINGMMFLERQKLVFCGTGVADNKQYYSSHQCQNQSASRFGPAFTYECEPHASCLSQSTFAIWLWKTLFWNLETWLDIISRVSQLFIFSWNLVCEWTQINYSLCQNTIYIYRLPKIKPHCPDWVISGQLAIFTNVPWCHKLKASSSYSISQTVNPTALPQTLFHHVHELPSMHSNTS